jgi:polyribonucleotide nucleotidyltransferase
MINPEMADMANSRLDLVVAGTKDAVLMVGPRARADRR